MNGSVIIGVVALAGGMGITRKDPPPDCPDGASWREAEDPASVTPAGEGPYGRVG